MTWQPAALRPQCDPVMQFVKLPWSLQPHMQLRPWLHAPLSSLSLLTLPS